MRLAAVADVYAGGSGVALLRAEDPAVSITLQAKAVAAQKLARERDERLAAMIANGVARALGAKRRR